MSRLHHTGRRAVAAHVARRRIDPPRLSDLLTRGDINDPVLEGHVVTIPDVRMSPDLKLATIYVMPLGGKDTKKSSPPSTATRNFCAARSRIGSI